MAVYDPARRRKGVRKGREAGCWIFIPAEELAAIGFSKEELAERGSESLVPWYRIWTRRKTILVQFYAEA